MGAFMLFKKKRWTLGVLSTLFYIVVTVLFFANTTYIMRGTQNVDGSLAVNQITSIVSSVLLILLYLGICLFARKRVLIRLNWAYFIPLFIFFVGSLLGIFLFNGLWKEGQLLYTRDAMERFSLVLYSISLFLTLYMAGAVIPKFTGGRNVYSAFYFLLSVFAIAAIVYSYIAEPAFYKAVFGGLSADGMPPVPQSFISNRNLYGFCIIMGLLAEFFLLVRKGRIYHWFIIAFLYFNLFFPASKTCILLGSFLVVAMLIGRMTVEIKNRRFFHAIFPVVVFLAITGLIITVGFIDFGGVFTPFHLFIKHFIDMIKQVGFDSGLARFDHFKEAMTIVNGSWNTLLFGFGYGAGRNAYAAYTLGAPYQFATFDISFGINLLDGGIFGMIFSVLCWLYLFIEIIGSFRRKSKYAYLELIAFVVFFGRSFMEVGDLITLHFGGLAIVLGLLVPLLAEKNALKSGESAVTGLYRYLSYEPVPVEKKPINAASIMLGLGLFFIPLLSIYSAVGIYTGSSYFIGGSRFFTYVLCYLTLCLYLFAIISFKRTRSWLRFSFFLALFLSYLGMGVCAFIFFDNRSCFYIFMVLSLVTALLYPCFGLLSRLKGNYLLILFLTLFEGALVVGLNALTVHFKADVYLYYLIALVGLAMVMVLLFGLYFEFWKFPAFAAIFEKIDAKVIPFIARRREKEVRKIQARLAAIQEKKDRKRYLKTLTR